MPLTNPQELINILEPYGYWLQYTIRNFNNLLVHYKIIKNGLTQQRIS